MLFEENRTFKRRAERSDQFQYIPHLSMIEKNLEKIKKKIEISKIETNDCGQKQTNKFQ